jgi:diketogulonate reductase-like aldo/keto reductase
VAQQAYSPLGDGKLATDADLTTIGKTYGKSAAQVLQQQAANANGPGRGHSHDSFGPCGSHTTYTCQTTCACPDGHEPVRRDFGPTNSQVAMKWLVDKGIAVVTKADSPEYLAQDIDMYSWNVSKVDTQALSANKKYPDVPSWACTA